MMRSARRAAVAYETRDSSLIRELIPPGAWHSMANTGENERVFLCCCSPAYRHGDTELPSAPGDGP